MARSPESNEAFFREVDEEVRREKMAEAGRRYGVIAAIVVVLALLGFGGWLGWQHHAQSQAGERGEQLTAAMSSLSSGKAADARTKLEALAATGTQGYAPLARLLLADMAVRDGKTQDAAAAFQKIADDDGTPQPIRDLALVRGTAIGFDTLPPQTVIDRLSPLMGAGKPWTGSAGEMVALAQIKAGKTKQAGATILATVKDPTVPASLRGRLAQLAGGLGVDVGTAATGGNVQP